MITYIQIPWIFQSSDYSIVGVRWGQLVGRLPLWLAQEVVNLSAPPKFEFNGTPYPSSVRILDECSLQTLSNTKTGVGGLYFDVVVACCSQETIKA